jgi:tetratricopeptide (TPR) repeat protein
LRRAKLYEELDQLDKALADYKELHKLDPKNVEVNSALMMLPKRIEEQTEKLKQEMFGNLFVNNYVFIVIFLNCH